MNIETIHFLKTDLTFDNTGKQHLLVLTGLSKMLLFLDLDDRYQHFTINNW